MLRMRWFRHVSLISLLAAVGCQGSTVHVAEGFGTDKAILTSADIRLVNKTTPRSIIGGRVTPESITCAEPSPDIAKAVAESFNLGGSLGIGGLPSGISPEAAAAISMARAEGMAQLTQRLATIQILRDGLFRACEAYANGAISNTTYALILSRLDDTMVTMLMGELAAGNFSGRMAAIGTGAGGGANAQLSSAIRKLTSALEETAGPAPSGGGGTANTTTTGTTATGPDNPAGSSDSSRNSSLQAAANSLTQAAQVIAGENAGFRQNPQIAETIATMQRKYIENVNLDAMAVACVNAMDSSNIDKDLYAKGQAFQVALENLKKKPDDLLVETAFDTAKQNYKDAIDSEKGSLLAAHCATNIFPEIAKFEQIRLDHILSLSVEEKNAWNAAEVLSANTDAVFQFLDHFTGRELSHDALPEQRKAHQAQVAQLQAAARAAREEADKQKKVVEADEGEVRKLEAAAFEPELSAQIAEGNRKSRESWLEDTKRRTAASETRVSQAEADLAASPNDSRLKAILETEKSNLVERKADQAAAQTEFDKAAAEATRLRAEADGSAPSLTAAREKAEGSRKRWRELDAKAGKLEQDLAVAIASL